jgi:hypothetical protein
MDETKRSIVAENALKTDPGFVDMMEVCTLEPLHSRAVFHALR